MGDEFGRRLAQVIQEKGLTKYRLAKLTNLSEAHVGNLTLGKRAPTPDVLEKLAPHLGVPLDQLKAWADADRLGDEGLERLERYVLHPRTRRPAIGVVNEQGETEYPPTEWELEQRAKAERMGLSFDLFTRPGFWSKPPEERRPLFEDIQEIMREAAKIMGEEHA